MKQLLFLLVVGCGGATPPASQPTPAPGAAAPATQSAGPTCTPGQVLDGTTCKDVATSLHGLRWEIPCKPHSGGSVCDAAIEKPTKSANLAGAPGTTYNVTLHFRGEVEQSSYKNGTADGLWYTGGESDSGSYNIYKLEISEPAQTYFLNAGKAGIRNTWPLDYQKTVKMAAGAKVTLSADAQDGALITNQDEKGKPVIPEGVPPAPQPFDGQFIQMDVVSVVPAK